VYPLPRIDDVLDALRDARVFSTLDLASGYWQLPVAPSDRPKTAFVTPSGLFEFNVMPFGLCNAPATFQRMMDVALADVKTKFALVYLDDVIVYSRSEHEHVEHLRQVFERLRGAGLHLKATKCKFVRRELPFLGHIVSADGVKVDPAKVQAVTEYKRPSDVRKLRAFLGLAGYYRRFIEGFSRRAHPLTELTKDVPFTWTADCDRAFADIKAALTQAPVLAYPQPERPFVVAADASGYGLGAVLSQIGDDGVEHVVAYASRKLIAAEKNYSATERECLAVVWAVQQWRHYLLDVKFTVRSDHHALQWLMGLKEPAGRLARWALRLQEFNMTIEYRPGRVHSNVDALSREPLDVALLQEDDAGAVAECQRADPQLARWFAYLEHKTLPDAEGEARAVLADAEHFVVEQGQLYRVVEPKPSKKRRAPLELRLAVPAGLVIEVLRASHDNAFAGHLGVERTFETVRRRYWWRSMYADVKEYVRSCRSCSSRKTARLPMAGRLQSITVERPWQLVAVDILGPLHATRTGNRYVLVFSDYLTKWVEAFPSARADAPTVARLLVDEVICRHGAPERLLSDRGSTFRSALVREVCQIFGTRRSYTTAYHPQTDGLVERFNHTLATMISHYVDSNQDNWDECLPAVLFAYRRSTHDSTGDSPFYLMYGREAMAPTDVAHGIKLSAEGPTSAVEWRARLVAALREAHELARANIQRAQAAQTEEYNERTRAAEFAPGDRVWLHVPHIKRGLSAKLTHPWHGPYRIERKVGEQTYELRAEDGRLHPGLVHVQLTPQGVQRAVRAARGRRRRATGRRCCRCGSGARCTHGRQRCA
jgi:transposase InsO family protein